jgi:tetratricopeptide (TPR) repeat protein
MRTYADQRMTDLLDVAVRASDESQRDDFARSLRSYRELIERLRAMNLSSGWATWGVAVSLDQLGDHAMAFDTIQEALRQDPLSPNCVRSFDVITERIREAVKKAAPADPSIAKLYGLLQRAGEADVPSHLAMVRHLCATGDLEQAATLAEAVTVLAPVSRDAWRVRAEVARLRRDDAAAASFEAEAKVRELEALPYAPVAEKGRLE